MFKYALLVFVALISACESGDVRVHSYWGTTIERPPVGSTYDWGADSATHDAAQEEHIRKAVQEDVEYEMDSMGFVKGLGSQKPDMIISMHWGRGLQPSPSGPEQRATMAVRVYEAATGKVIYCASADALIEPTLSPEVRRARMSTAIQELLRPLSACAAKGACRR